MPKYLKTSNLSLTLFKNLKANYQWNENKIHMSPKGTKNIKKIINMKCAGLDTHGNSAIPLASDTAIGRPQNQLFCWSPGRCNNFFCDRTGLSVIAQFEMMQGWGWKLSRHNDNYHDLYSFLWTHICKDISWVFSNLNCYLVSGIKEWNKKCINK